MNTDFINSIHKVTNNIQSKIRWNVEVSLHNGSSILLISHFTEKKHSIVLPSVNSFAGPNEIWIHHSLHRMLARAFYAEMNSGNQYFTSRHQAIFNASEDPLLMRKVYHSIYVAAEWFAFAWLMDESPELHKKYLIHLSHIMRENQFSWLPSNTHDDECAMYYGALIDAALSEFTSDRIYGTPYELTEVIATLSGKHGRIPSLHDLTSLANELLAVHNNCSLQIVKSDGIDSLKLITQNVIH